MSYSIPGYSEERVTASRSAPLILGWDFGSVASAYARSTTTWPASWKEFGALCHELRRLSGRKPAGGFALRSQRLRKKAGLG